jgi:hypothetical protein
MAERRSGAWRNVVASLLVLTPIVGFVVYSSLQVAAIECEVCMRYEGYEQCRAASAATREEAVRSATDNACALLTSGMTNTIRCGQSDPLRVSCGAVSETGSDHVSKR